MVSGFLVSSVLGFTILVIISSIDVLRFSDILKTEKKEIFL